MAQQSPRRIATIIWAALVFGVTAFLGVAAYLVFGLRGGGVAPDPGLAPVMIGVSAVLSLVTVAVSWLWAVRMRIRASGGGAAARPAPYPPGPEADAVTRLIVASALCEGGGLFAVVVLLVTGEPLALAPFAVSYVALLAHFPGDRHWAQLVGAPLGTGAASNRMIRE